MLCLSFFSPWSSLSLRNECITGRMFCCRQSPSKKRRKIVMSWYLECLIINTFFFRSLFSCLLHICIHIIVIFLTTSWKKEEIVVKSLLLGLQLNEFYFTCLKITAFKFLNFFYQNFIILLFESEGNCLTSFLFLYIHTMKETLSHLEVYSLCIFI